MGIYSVDQYFLNWGRVPGQPSAFPSIYINAAHDLNQIYISTGTLLVVFCALLMIPSFQWRKRTTLYLYLFTFAWLFVGWAMLFSIYGYNWQYAKISTTTQYAADSTKEANVTLELKIGLFGFNVTCLGNPKFQNLSDQFPERQWAIDWNEHYRWSYPWHQGRIGYGKYSSPINVHFRESQVWGVPYPVQWIAEYLTLDGEYIRWGRHFRMAGYFTWVIQRTAFGAWLVALVLFLLRCQRAAASTCVVLSILIGAGQLVYLLQTSTRKQDGSLYWQTTVNPFRPGANFNELSIPFRDVNGVPQLLTPTIHRDWWLMTIAGIVSIFVAVFSFPNKHYEAVFQDSGDHYDELVEAWEKRRGFRSTTSRAVEATNKLNGDKGKLREGKLVDLAKATVTAQQGVSSSSMSTIQM